EGDRSPQWDRERKSPRADSCRESMRETESADSDPAASCAAKLPKRFAHSPYGALGSGSPGPHIDPVIRYIGKQIESDKCETYDDRAAKHGVHVDAQE